MVLVGGDPVVYLERGGRALQTLLAAGDARLDPALAALVERVRAGAIKRVALEKVDGQPAMTSPLGPRNNTSRRLRTSRPRMRS